MRNCLIFLWWVSKQYPEKPEENYLTKKHHYYCYAILYKAFLTLQIWPWRSWAHCRHSAYSGMGQVGWALQSVHSGLMLSLPSLPALCSSFFQDFAHSTGRSCHLSLSLTPIFPSLCHRCPSGLCSPNAQICCDGSHLCKKKQKPSFGTQPPLVLPLSSTRPQQSCLYLLFLS